MTVSEVNALPNGLYQVYWGSDPTLFSLAALGMCEDGNKWIAPCNWVSTMRVDEKDGDGFIIAHSIKRLEPLLLVKDAHEISRL